MAKQFEILDDGAMSAFNTDPVLQEKNGKVYLDQTPLADATASLLSAVVDIGSTTIAVSLIDNKVGEEIASKTGLNPQRAYGDDVLSRASYIIDQADGLDHLHSLIIKQVEDLVLELIEEAGFHAEDLYAIYVAANAIMNHILLGISPVPLARSPYKLQFKGKKRIDFDQLNLNEFGQGQLVVLPNITAFVGGDVTAGIISTDIYKKKSSQLFIDIGTNGELILQHQNKLYATSCAAGPALEGMGIECGVTAQLGAIEEARFVEGQLNIQTIGQQAAIGICGSGVLALIREFLKAGLINQRGNIKKSDQLSPALQSFLVEGKKALWVDQEAGIYMSQKDIRQLQMAKGAILTGVLALLDFAGLEAKEVEQVYIAGQFGKHLSAESLTQLGLLPMEFHHKIEYVGNTSKSGCFMISMNRDLFHTVDQLVSDIKYLPLTLVEDFDLLLAKSTLFPKLQQKS